MQLDHGEILLRLGLATLLGLLFGAERKRSKKPAGARTHLLVCLAACVIAMISAYGFDDAFFKYPGNVNMNADPARLAVGLLTGIGFLCAGIIWRSPSGGVQASPRLRKFFFWQRWAWAAD